MDVCVWCGVVGVVFGMVGEDGVDGFWNFVVIGV